MARNWNTTGLYRASKDRMPAKRSHKIRSTVPAAVLVKPPAATMCLTCCFATDTVYHKLYCPVGVLSGDSRE